MSDRLGRTDLRLNTLKLMHSEHYGACPEARSFPEVKDCIAHMECHGQPWGFPRPLMPVKTRTRTHGNDFCTA